MKFIFVFSALILGSISAHSQFETPITTTTAPKKNVVAPPVCRDPRFRLIADCESVVYVD